MTGQLLHRTRITGFIIGVLALLGCVFILVMRQSKSQEPTMIVQDKPPEQKSEKPPADLIEGAQRPYNLKKDPEQTRLPPLMTFDTSGVEDKLRREMDAMRQSHADEIAKLRSELTKKPSETPQKTVDPQAQERAREAKEEARRRTEALKSARTSTLGMIRHDEETEEKSGKGIGKRKRPNAKYFLAAGSIVNCEIENGINTEHKVPVIARVTGPVYDHATGQEAESLQDSVLIGEYQSVLVGDKTVTVAWNTLVLHDGSEIELGGQPGGDQLGRAGLPAEIDNKWGTSILAMITRSAQQASVIGISTAAGTTAAERMAGAAAGSMVQDTGQKLTRTMNVNPTGYVEPGTLCSMTLKSALDLTKRKR